MRVLHINSKGYGGGGAIQALQLAHALKERGIEVWFASKPNQGWEEITGKLGLEFVPLPLRGHLDLTSVRLLNRTLRLNKVDILHIQKGVEHSIGLAVAYLNPKVGFIATRGVTFALDYFNKWKFKVGRLDAIIANARHVKDVLVASGVPPDKIRIIYGGVDLSRFDRRLCDARQVRLELGIPSDAYLIGYIAQLRRWKDHETLLRAVASLNEARLKPYIAFIGADNEGLSEELSGKATRFGIEKQRLLMTGYRPDVPRMISALDLSVNCSYEGEGITGALRESLAMGCPVVATDIGGNRELIEHRVSGLLVPARDVCALAEAIKWMMENKDAAAMTAKAGMMRVRQLFSVDAQVSKVMALYQEILISRQGCVQGKNNI